LEAELLLAEVLGCARIRLYVDFERVVSAEHLATFRDYVKRRGEKREPLQYIIGNAQFIDLKIKVSPATLIPRPETEILAVWASDRLKEIQLKTPVSESAEAPTSLVPRVLDMCTGTGCIALYLASKHPTAHVVGTDLSADALAMANENAKAHTLESRVVFLQGDLFDALKTTYEKDPFDVIVTNPPYVDETTRATLQPEVRDFEPALALFAGEGGTAIARRILSECDAWLKPGGHLGLEFGAGQHEIIQDLAAATGIFDDIVIERDGGKLPRFLLARKKKAY